MKFNKFIEVKEKAQLLNESFSYDTLTIINVAEALESLGIKDDEVVSEDVMEVLNSLDVLDEGAAEAAGNLWKTIKGLIQLGGLGKKYQKSMVDEAAEEMDFARKRKASETKEETEGLKKAHEAKKDALKDQVSAIAEKMDDIAKTEWLKTRVKKIKIEARIAKNKILLKIANEEEAKELKISMQKSNDDLTTADNQLAEYQSDNKDAVKDLLKEKKEELKKKVSEIKDDLKSNKEEIDGVTGNESEKSDKHIKLAELKTERGKLLSELIKAKEAFNQMEENDDEKYDTESNQEQLETLAQEVKDHTEKAGEEETEDGEEEETEDGEEETEDGEEETEEETEDETEDDEEETEPEETEPEETEPEETEPEKTEPEETEPETKPEKKEGEEEDKKASDKEEQTKYKKEQLEKKIESAEAKIAELEKGDGDKDKIAAIKKNVDAMYDKLSDLGESFDEFAIDEMTTEIDSILIELNSMSAPQSKYVSFANFIANRNK